MEYGYVRTLKKRRQLYVNLDDLIVHIESLALMYKKDGQDVIGKAYDILARDIREDAGNARI